jgi:N-acetylglucosaminyl-diphospho-decaprenol L-rhamnosyltransferase
VAGERSRSRVTLDAPAEDLEDRPGLDVVIVAYRGRDLLRACLASLRENAPHDPHAVYVVDNASADGTVEMIRADFPEVSLIECDRNLGFGAANNIAIPRGRKRYVLVLNPDTRITPGALDALLRLMEERSAVGVCGCRLVREDGTFDHASRRAFPTILGALGHFSGVGRGARAPRRLAQYRATEVEAGPVDAVNGAFMLMRRAALVDVGLFDEGYWMYMEDLDLCYRAARAGWVTWYEPAAVVTHVKGGTSGSNRTLRVNYAFHYGMVRFYRKHYADSHSRLFNLAIYAGIEVKFGASAVRSAFSRRLRGRRRPEDRRDA